MAHSTSAGSRQCITQPHKPPGSDPRPAPIGTVRGRARVPARPIACAAARSDRRYVAIAWRSATGSPGGTTKPLLAVNDDLRHARHVGADHRPGAGHRLEQRLPEKLGDRCRSAVRRRVHAGQHDARGPAILLDERAIVRIVHERDLLAASALAQRRQILLVHRLADDAERDIRRESASIEVMNTLVRKNAPDEQHAVSGLASRREASRIHASEDHAGGARAQYVRPPGVSTR